MPDESQMKDPVEETVSKVRENCSLAEDQEKRDYYYDDAHGYEVFVPEDEAEDADDESLRGSKKA